MRTIYSFLISWRIFSKKHEFWTFNRVAHNTPKIFEMSKNYIYFKTKLKNHKIFFPKSNDEERCINLLTKIQNLRNEKILIFIEVIFEKRNYDHNTPIPPITQKQKSCVHSPEDPKISLLNFRHVSWPTSYQLFKSQKNFTEVDLYSNKWPKVVMESGFVMKKIEVIIFHAYR